MNIIKHLKELTVTTRTGKAHLNMHQMQKKTLTIWWASYRVNIYGMICLLPSFKINHNYYDIMLLYNLILFYIMLYETLWIYGIAATMTTFCGDISQYWLNDYGPCSFAILQKYQKYDLWSLQPNHWKTNELLHAVSVWDLCHPLSHVQRSKITWRRAMKPLVLGKTNLTSGLHLELWSNQPEASFRHLMSPQKAQIIRDSPLPH